jgi:metal-sulfur cluster biosynthetic enzyme
MTEDRDRNEPPATEDPTSTESRGTAAREPVGEAPGPETGAGAGTAAAPTAGSGAGSGSAPGGDPGRTSAPSQQELAVRAALEAVLDPEIGLSVIDLGLIREIHFLPDHTHIRMMLTTPFCPYAPQLMEEVKQATMGVVPKLCEVEIMPDAWSPQLMPDPGLLGFSF